MDPREQDRLLEALEELTASLRVTPQLPQRLRARGVGRLVVADTDVLDGLQLAKVADKDHGDVAEVVVLRIDIPRQSTPALPAVTGSACSGRKLFQ